MSVDNEERETASVDEPLVRVSGLSKHFNNDSGFLGGLQLDQTGRIPRPVYDRSWVRAVDDVSFAIEAGETLGLVGESGCGKSTLARTIIKLLEPTDGDVLFEGQNLAAMSGESLRTMRQDMQFIFQDPQSSLDPRMKVGRIVEEPMRAHGLPASDPENGSSKSEQRRDTARTLLDQVGLDPQHYNRYPHQFSGGQRQRINLARALSVNPDFIVCDEPTSALDASIQAQVLNTMRELQAEFGLTYLFISHDLSVIRYIADRVAVMYLGEIVELAETEELFENPRHPYTNALLEAIPVPDPRASPSRDLLVGEVPSPIDPPSGCRFRTRCPVLIAPEEYDFSDREWENVRSFVRAVTRRAPELLDASEASIRGTFFDDSVPRGEAGRIVDRTIDRVVAEEWDAASDLLEQFTEKSVCAREVPRYTVDSEHGTGEHHAHCHRNRGAEGDG